MLKMQLEREKGDKVCLNERILELEDAVKDCQSQVSSFDQVNHMS